MTDLHVRYRPTTFDQVLGQKHVVDSLRKAKGHSYLFTGPSGCGKTTLARILGNKFAGGRATTQNLIEVAAADNTGVDDMRRLLEVTRTRAIGKSPVKTIVLDECHRLSGQAWDVLLKPIEEPPVHVYWCLCTTNLNKVPKTILTRCLRYDLKPVAEDDLLQLLSDVADAEKIDADEILECIVEASGGSPRQALVNLEACKFAETAAEARTLMRSASQMREPIDLARLLVQRQGVTWAAVVRLINAMENVDAETVRIIVVTYLAGCLAKAKTEKEAVNLLRVLEPFNGIVYNHSDKLAPLFMSVGLALGLDK
jgi:DNA polymerase III subunit gamma/tau